jgi:hypothetical protein
MQREDEWKEVTSLPAAPAAPARSQGQSDGWKDVQGFSAQQAQPQRDYTWGEVPRQALRNFPASLGGVYKDTLSALASPIQTGKAAFQMLGGAAISALPEGGQQWLMSVANDPAKMQESINMARAAGGQIAQDYGTSEGFRRKLAEDPAAVLADFSILFSGGAAATARTAPAVSSGLRAAENLTNPFVPLAAVAETRVPGTNKSLSQVGSDVGASVSDILSGRRGESTARNIIRQTLGEQNIPTIEQLSDPRFRDMSAAEAVLASGVDRPQFQALARDVASIDPQNRYFQREQARPAQRQAALAAVTPDEATAIANREIAANPLYLRGRDPNALVDQAGVAEIIKNIDTTIEQNRGNKQLREALNTVKQGLKGSKTASQVASVDDSIRGLLGSRDNAFIQGQLMDVRRQIDGVLPDLQKARQTFAQMSEPVNQAQILGEMQQRLRGPLDVERPGQFMRVLGEGEGALIKRSTGAPRFEQGDLMRILTEEQGRAVTGVSEQLMRESQMARQAQRGEPGYRAILEQNQPFNFRIPNVLNRTVMVTNRTLALLENNISKSTQNALEKAMYSGADLNEFLKTVPVTERPVIRQALDQATNINTMRNVGLIERLQEDEEPYRAELRGMVR